MQANCLNYGQPFEARRSSAQFCSSAHRVAAHRASSVSVCNATRAAEKPFGALISPPTATNTKSVTLRLDPHLVPDEKWPGMYRITRAKAALEQMK
jgi:hypothetical protein